MTQFPTLAQSLRYGKLKIRFIGCEADYRCTYLIVRSPSLFTFRSREIGSRRSGTEFNTDATRRMVVATRGLDMAFLRCISADLLAVRPILSTAYQEAKVSQERSTNADLHCTFSRSPSDNSLTGSAEENARWLVLMRGTMRCFERISADILYPRKQVSHLHLKVSQSNSNAKS